ncbi:MAG TPA: hypothetical protein VFW25_01640 [Silvibacterium sp.]|nr:hypothetical protein [Silvibacterium sp.]
MTSFSKFSLTLVVAGLLSATAGSAQTTKTQTIVIPPQWSATCPIAMSAQHGIDGGTLAVRGGAHKGMGQQLQLTLNNSGKSAISAVRIIMNGWNAKGRTLRALETNSSVTDASETVDLRLSVDAGKTVDTNVWVSGLTSVDSIDLVGVSYADGKNWKAAGAEACRITPDPEMLISSR